MANGILGFLAILFIDVESVVLTGPIEFILGLLLIIFAAILNHHLGITLGGLMISIAIALTALVNILHWSPSDAHTPFVYITTPFVLCTTPMFVFALLRIPKAFFEWQCPSCGYLIYGLESPQCPECGTELNPDMVEKYRQHELSRA